jgi:hypothetical protein
VPARYDFRLEDIRVFHLVRASCHACGHKAIVPNAALLPGAARLGTLPNVSIHYGHFLTHEITMPRVPVPGRRQEYVRVIKTEEKGSDVNLATHLLHDAHMGRFEVAVVVSNDSDLLEPIKIVRDLLHKKVGILNPHKKPSRALLPHIDFIKQIRAGALRASQFPATMSDRHGTFTKPSTW